MLHVKLCLFKGFSPLKKKVKAGVRNLLTNLQHKLNGNMLFFYICSFGKNKQNK